jgi:7-keto-8-aminopelargonate synthetase-like enzyme
MVEGSYPTGTPDAPRKTIFDKAAAYTAAREVQAAGVYPYFAPIEESTTSEVRIGGAWKIMLGSNNYLGLTHHPDVIAACEAALRKYGSGSTGSRLLNGTIDLHEVLEDRLAKLMRKEAALVFTTGFQTSLGVIATLVGRGDHVYLDKLDHACIVDGARLALGEVHRYAHNDVAQLERQLAAAPPESVKLVVTDGVFSMEGTIADLPGVAATARKHGAAVLVDDAHALGVLGDDGSGTARHFEMDDQVDLVMATFSKSLASVGGVVAGPEDVLHYLRHHARADLHGEHAAVVDRGHARRPRRHGEGAGAPHAPLGEHEADGRRAGVGRAGAGPRRDADPAGRRRRAAADAPHLALPVRRRRVRAPRGAAGRAA